MGDLLALDFMRQALVAAVLVGLAAPLVGAFLVQRRLVELLPDGELAVHALLGDVEALHVEEPILAHRADERLRELLPAFGRLVLAEVNGDEVGPIKVFLEKTDG